MKRTLAIVCALSASAAARAAEPGYYREPTLHGERLVFVCEGDLFTARLDDAEPIIAYRLTTSDGQESRPRLSPDGKTIAFAAQYDGNTDVYLMPVDGGTPRRLTFHPGVDAPLDWSADGTQVSFRSSRAHPQRRYEAWTISVGGGEPSRQTFGECTMLSRSATGQRFAFTRWSNERWHWKGYRGGAAPDLWMGDLGSRQFSALTTDPANDLYPMWIAGRVFFLSDRSGHMNLHSVLPQGGDLTQHTSYRFDPGQPAAPEGYDIRSATEDVRRGGSRIVFAQAGGFVLYDIPTATTRRLDVRVASDRIATRARFAPADTAVRDLALSPDGETLVVGARGEIIGIDVDTGAIDVLTRSSFARERSPVFVNDEQIALISDASGEEQIALLPADGSALPSLVTEDREDWLFPPVTSPDGAWLAFSDKTMRLHVVNMQSIVRHTADQAHADEILEYRFSPDSRWLAYTKPQANGLSQVFVRNIRTQRSFPVSDRQFNDRSPRWDPAGRYLYMISDRHFDPVLDVFDRTHVFTGTARIIAVPLTDDTPPPDRVLADAAGFDLAEWATVPPPPDDDDVAGIDPLAPVDPAAPREEEDPPLRLDTDGLPHRHVVLSIPPGRFRDLEAQYGAITFLSEPTRGLLQRRSRQAPAGGHATLRRHDLVKGTTTDIAQGLNRYVMNRAATTIAYDTADGIIVRPLQNGDVHTLTIDEPRLRIDIEAEWKQMLVEAWRLQRDFYWAPDLGGVDWPAIRTKYEALLPRVATRADLNDVIGAMIGELGTSHTYIFGGAYHEHEQPDLVSVGLLGIDVERAARGVTITRILPSVTWDPDLVSPLARPHLAVEVGDHIVAVDGQPIGGAVNLLDPLQGTAGQLVTLTITDGSGANPRDVTVRTTDRESELRYHAWVAANRARVEEATGGVVGYVHIPDMGGAGLATFARQFYPQFDRRGLVIDVRGNGGGFVSQMIIERLARRVVGFMQPRHGATTRYPARAPHAQMVTLIDPHAGSDGDIFPAVFRRLELGPLIGTRTWGGVVGIRGDKTFVDLGLSTQPEFAWWDDDGWSIENFGVEPDIMVDTTPNDHVTGRDPVLDRAIATLQLALERDSKELPQPPPYPRR